MGLVGKTTEEQIWNYLQAKIGNEFGTAGLMGNIYAESGLKSNNLQNSYEKKLGYTDETYTAAVDNGTYTNFVRDSAGYGLCQWTYWSRKQNLLDYATQTKRSIGDLEMQLDFLFIELNKSYPTVLNALKNAASVQDASNEVLLKFERPANQSIENQKKRASYGKIFYDKFAGTAPVDPVKPADTPSSSINIVKKTSTNHTTKKANRAINWIVLHYTAGVKSEPGHAEKVAQGFATSNRDASADFICDDGEIVQYNPDPRNYYCWSVGGSKYTSMTTSLGGVDYGKCMNNNSISIEMCSRKKNTSTLSVTDDDWYLTDATVNNAIALTKYLMKEYNIDINHVIMHHMVTGKVCPQPWCKREDALAGWYDFLKKVGGGVTPTPTPVTTSYWVKVTARDGLNVRKGPGVSNSVVMALNYERYVQIIKEQNGWGLLSDNSGWINLKYTVKEEPPKYKVTANVLNIRSGAGMNYSVVGTIKKGEVYTIVEQTNGWGRLKSGTGWVSMKYMEKV